VVARVTPPSAAVAQKRGFSLKALAAANNRDLNAMLRPGTTLRLAEPGGR
jgi:hypothetical protein